MPYQAEKDATIPRVIAEGKNDAGEVRATYESVTYAAGTVIYEDDIAPHILRRLDEGDDHLSSLLRYIDENEAREILAQQASESSVGGEEPPADHQDNREGTSPTVEPGWAEEEPRETEEEVEEEPEEPEGDAGETEGESETEEVGDTETEEESEEAEEPESTEVEDETEGEAEEAEASSDDEPASDSTEETEEEVEVTDSEEESAEKAETTEVNLDEMSKRELNRVARSLGIEGRSKMDEDQLRKAIKKAEAK